jgi:hypothetical protein
LSTALGTTAAADGLGGFGVYDGCALAGGFGVSGGCG